MYDIKNGAILFTDIVGFSRLWKLYPKKMIKAVKEHNRLLYRFVRKYVGIVVKTTGDAFMVYFRGLSGFKRAIELGIDVQKKLNKNPILLNKETGDKIMIRIGLSQGPLNVQTVKFQSTSLKDYYGTTVNLASRMKARVSKPGTVSFCFWDTEIPVDYIIKLSKLVDIIISDYTDNCKYNCKDIKELYGAPGVVAFTVLL